jgi:hypothetical protein
MSMSMSMSWTQMSRHEPSHASIPPASSQDLFCLGEKPLEVGAYKFPGFHLYALLRASYDITLSREQPTDRSEGECSSA